MPQLLIRTTFFGNKKAGSLSSILLKNQLKHDDPELPGTLGHREQASKEAVDHHGAGSWETPRAVISLDPENCCATWQVGSFCVFSQGGPVIDPHPQAHQ